jgi:hypothetical protein
LGRDCGRPLVGIPTHVQTLGAVERLQTDVVLRDQLGADPARGLDFDTLFADMYEGLFQAMGPDVRGVSGVGESPRSAGLACGTSPD